MLQRCRKTFLKKTVSALTSIMQCRAKTLKCCKSINTLVSDQNKLYGTEQLPAYKQTEENVKGKY